MKSSLSFLPSFALASAFVLASAAHGQSIIFSEDFEGTHNTSTGWTSLTDGFLADGWINTAFTTNNPTNLLEPAAGSAWLDPVPSALGNIFGILRWESAGGGTSGTAIAGTGSNFTDGTTYELTFTQFRRDDLGGLGVRAAIWNITTDSVVEETIFGAVTTTGTLVDRTVTYTVSGGPEIGDEIGIRFFSEAGTEQVGIDNISLTAVPEPAAYAIVLGLSVISFAALRRRRRA